MNWPQDADGDVLRRLKQNGFDFTKIWQIDFNIDFREWPLQPEKEKEIRSILPGCEFFDPDEEDIEDGDLIGYVLTKEKAIITYEYVVSKQKELTEKMRVYGGWCESWGVMH